MHRKIVVGVVLFCAAGGVLMMSRSYAGSEVPQAHSQKEFDTLFKDQKSASILDQGGHAFDNQAARLFWFTSLDEAKAEAKKEGKPILSLRMLGNLSDDYSCANSRFFRTALYPNAQINSILRQKFVLHWSSERPVPIVTIDFGDGRKLKRTLTGNSAHYLMDENGNVLDVLPGLYGPKAFQDWLEGGEDLWQKTHTLSDDARMAELKAWHTAALTATYERKIRADYSRFGPRQAAEPANLTEAQLAARKAQQDKREEQIAAQIKTLSDATLQSSVLLDSAQTTAVRVAVPNPYTPMAEEAERLTMSKTSIEMPLLDATRPRGSSIPSSPLVLVGERRDLGAYAATYSDETRLDDASRQLLLSKLPGTVRFPVATIQTVQQTTGGKPVDTQAQTVARFEDSMTFDTARNEYYMHAPIHAVFAAGEQGSFEELNRKIYDRLFLTPSSDPWLGLLPDEVYNGLQNGGIVQTGAASKATTE